MDGQTPILPITLEEGLVLIFNGILLLVIIVLLGILLITTMINVTENCTTIEQLEVKREELATRRTGHGHQFPFNLGWSRNLELVLGKRRWAWPFPLPSSWQLADQGDGLEFDTSDGSPDYLWPPEDYCSDTECSSAGEDDVLSLRSDQYPKYRARRDSEGFIIPTGLPWHHHSDPQVNRV